MWSRTGDKGDNEIGLPRLSTNSFGLNASLDDSVSTPGDQKMEALVPPAHKCTHALVVLSQ